MHNTMYFCYNMQLCAFLKTEIHPDKRVELEILICFKKVVKMSKIFLQKVSCMEQITHTHNLLLIFVSKKTSAHCFYKLISSVYHCSTPKILPWHTFIVLTLARVCGFWLLRFKMKSTFNKPPQNTCSICLTCI